MRRRKSVRKKDCWAFRKTLGVYANLRPVRSYKSLLDSSPLKNHWWMAGLIIVRELTGGHVLRNAARHSGSGRTSAAVNTMATRAAIERVAAWPSPGARQAPEAHVGRQIQRAGKLAALAARGHRGRADFPDVALDHLLVETAHAKLVLTRGASTWW